MWEHRRVSTLIAELASRSAATLAGLILFVLTTVSLVSTVIVPRSLRSIISDSVARAVTGTAFGLARLRRDYVKRDAILSWAGPMIIVFQLITWLLLYLLSYGLLLYGVGGSDLGDSLRQAGSSLFTLGFADVNTADATVIDFLAAATGPIVIALLIGFLPTIYSSYIEREAAVASLGVAAGEPAWGPEFLSRFALSGHLDAAAKEFEEWAAGAARIRLSHSTYPVLMWVRSPRAYRHYLVSLLAVLDAAALWTSLTKRKEPPPAFHLLIQGGQTMEVLNVGLMQHLSLRRRIPFVGRFRPRDDQGAYVFAQLALRDQNILAIERAADEDALHGLGKDAVEAMKVREQQGTELPRAEFDKAVDMLRRSGFPIERDDDEAWQIFSVIRSRYEGAAYSMFRILDAAPAPWTGDRRIPTPTVWPSSALAMLEDEKPEP